MSPVTTAMVRVLGQDVDYRPGGADGVTFPADVEVWVLDGPEAVADLDEGLRQWSRLLREEGKLLAEGGRFTVETRGGTPVRVFTGMVLRP